MFNLSRETHEYRSWNDIIANNWEFLFVIDTFFLSQNLVVLSEWTIDDRVQGP